MANTCTEGGGRTLLVKREAGIKLLPFTDVSVRGDSRPSHPKGQGVKLGQQEQVQ